MTITANEISKNDVSLFENLLDKYDEVVINIKGKDKYCIIPFDEYQEYRAYKLKKSHKEVLDDIENGNYHTDINHHLSMIEEAIKNG